MKQLKFLLAAVLLAKGATAMAAYEFKVPSRGLLSATPVAAPLLACSSQVGEIGHNQTKTAYSRSIGSSPADCADQSTVLSCNNGVLSSSNKTLSLEAYGEASCSVVAAPPPAPQSVVVWNLHGYDPVTLAGGNPVASATITGLYPAGIAQVDAGSVTFGIAESTCYRCQFKLYKDGVAYSSSPVATDFNGLSWAVNLESGSSYQLHLDSNNSDWPGPVIYAR